MFCCGTNVVFRRAALEQIGGFPQDSVTEDFELSIRLHEHGWRSRYVAGGARARARAGGHGVLRLPAAALGARLPVGAAARCCARGCRCGPKLHYALSASYFLTGFTVLAYMAFPVVRIVTGAQPLASTTADQFLAHFAPYFGLALLGVTFMGGGAYTFKAFALQTASFWIHVQAGFYALIGAPRHVRGHAEGGRPRAPAARRAGRRSSRSPRCSRPPCSGSAARPRPVHAQQRRVRRAARVRAARGRVAGAAAPGAPRRRPSALRARRASGRGAGRPCPRESARPPHARAGRRARGGARRRARRAVRRAADPR